MWPTPTSLPCIRLNSGPSTRSRLASGVLWTLTDWATASVGTVSAAAVTADITTAASPHPARAAAPDHDAPPTRPELT